MREALGLDGSVPALACDARDRASVRDVLVALMDRGIHRHLETRKRTGALAR